MRQVQNIANVNSFLPNVAEFEMIPKSSFERSNCGSSASKNTPPLQIPMFPIGVTHITPSLAFQNAAGNITYFNACLPVFSHREDDRQSFKMITAPFRANGYALQADIARAFGGTAISKTVPS